MNNKYLRSILISSILMIVVLMPVQAQGRNLELNIWPQNPFINSSPEYHASMVVDGAPLGGFFFLNLTIPGGYNFTLPPSGKRVAKYSWFKGDHSEVIVVIISNNTDNKTVDIRFSIDSGSTFITRKNLSMTNIIIGTTSLKFTEPSYGNAGYINLSLGGNAGPVMSREKVEVELANILKDPGTKGVYTWYLEAKNDPSGTAYTASDNVNIK